MTIINRERYYCSDKRERGTCDSTVGIKAAEIEERVLTGLKDILLGNEDGRGVRRGVQGRGRPTT